MFIHHVLSIFFLLSVRFYTPSKLKWVPMIGTRFGLNVLLTYATDLPCSLTFEPAAAFVISFPHAGRECVRNQVNFVDCCLASRFWSSWVFSRSTLSNKSPECAAVTTTTVFAVLPEASPSIPLCYHLPTYHHCFYSTGFLGDFSTLSDPVSQLIAQPLFGVGWGGEDVNLNATCKHRCAVNQNRCAHVSPLPHPFQRKMSVLFGGSRLSE